MTSFDILEAMSLPLMWGVFVDKNLHKELTERAVERRKVADWNGWIEQLKPKRKAAKQIATSDS